MSDREIPIGVERARLALRSLLVADGIVLVKNRRALLVSIIVPVFLLVVTNHRSSALGQPLALIALCIAIGLLSTSIMGYAIATARDRDAGVFQRLRVSPAPTWMIMTSRLAVQAVANLILSLVVVIVGSAIHHVNVSPGRYVLVLLVSIFAGAVFLSIGQALVGLVRSADTVNATGRFLYIGLLLLGLWGESGQLGHAWESISRWTPVGAVATLFGGVLGNGTWSSKDSLALLAGAGYIAVCAYAGIRWFRWEAR